MHKKRKRPIDGNRVANQVLLTLATIGEGYIDELSPLGVSNANGYVVRQLVSNGFADKTITRQKVARETPDGLKVLSLTRTRLFITQAGQDEAYRLAMSP